MSPMVMTVAVLASLAICGAASAQPRDEFNKLSASTPWRVAEGFEAREFKLRGEVIVQQKRVGGEVHTITSDMSGHGAVMCGLQTFITFVIINDVCHVNDTKWRSVLMSAIGRIGEFAERNAIETVTKDEIVAKAERDVKQAVVEASAEEINQACTEPHGFSEAYSHLRKEGKAKFLAQIDNLLSVERPAVHEPCY